MGAAGKAREEELLAEIANLRKQLADRAARIDELTETVAEKDGVIAEKGARIAELEAQILELKAQIANLQEQLTQAQSSGDQVVTELRDKLKRLQEEFDAFKKKSAQDFQAMQTQLTDAKKKELDAQKARYEAMLDELRKAAAGDKEFIVNELKRKIAELEKQIEDMRGQHARHVFL